MNVFLTVSCISLKLLIGLLFHVKLKMNNDYQDSQSITKKSIQIKLFSSILSLIVSCPGLTSQFKKINNYYSCWDRAM